MALSGFVRLGLVVVLSSTAVAAVAAARLTRTDQEASALELKEPPLEFVLEHDGKSADVLVDQPIQLKTAQGDIELILRAKPSRSFKVAGVSFQYPASHGFEVEQCDEYVSWTLDGNNVVITLFRYSGEIEAKDVAEPFVAAFVGAIGSKNCKSRDTSITLGGIKLEGTRVDSVVAGASIAHEVFAFKAKGNSHLIMFQDSLDEDGSESDEHASVIQCVARSFAIER